MLLSYFYENLGRGVNNVKYSVSFIRLIYLILTQDICSKGLQSNFGVRIAFYKIGALRLNLKLKDSELPCCLKITPLF